MFDLLLFVDGLESDTSGNGLRFRLVEIVRVEVEDAVLADNLTQSVAAHRHRNDLVVADDFLGDGLLERHEEEPLPVDGLVVHREDIIIVALQDALGCRHEQPLADGDVLVKQERGEALALHANGLVGLVKDSKIEGVLGQFGRFGETGAALIGGKDDPMAIATPSRA